MPSVLNQPISTSYTKGVNNIAFQAGLTPFFLFVVFQDFDPKPEFQNAGYKMPFGLYKLSQYDDSLWFFQNADFRIQVRYYPNSSYIIVIAPDNAFIVIMNIQKTGATDFINGGYVGSDLITVKGIAKIGYYIPPQYANIDLMLDSRPDTRGNNFIGTTADYFQITTSKKDNSKLRFTRNEIL